MKRKEKNIVLLGLISIIALLTCYSCNSEVPGQYLPVVTTQDMYQGREVFPVSAYASGTLVDARGGIVKQCGICWSSTGLPTINDNKAVAQFDSTGKSFNYNITGLRYQSAYLVRAYVTTNKGTGYGKPVSVKTPNLVDITTDSVKSITTDSAYCGGSIVTDYGYGILERGLCWIDVASGRYPTISDSKVNDGASKTGYYTVPLSGLKPRTTYLVRAYAVTYNLGVAYADPQTFTTK